MSEASVQRLRKVKDFAVKLTDGTTRTTNAYQIVTAPGLVIHKDVAEGRGWVVAHEESTLTVVPNRFRVRRDAQMFVESVATYTDWTMPSDSFTGNFELGRKVANIARQFCK